MPNNVFVLFAQDKFHRGQPDAERRPALRRRAPADHQRLQPVLHQRRTCRRQEQHRAEAGLHLEAVRHRDLDRPRRLRHLLRQDHDDHDDAVRVDRRLQRFVHRVISHQLGGPWPEQRPAADRSHAGQRTGRQSSRDQRAVPARVGGPQHRPGLPRQPRPAGAAGPTAVARLRAAGRPAHGRHRRLHQELESRSADQLRPEPGAARRHQPDRPDQLHRPREHRRPARHLAVRQPGAHPCQRRLVGIRRGQLLAREAVQQPLGGPGVLRGRLRARQRRGQPDEASTIIRCGARSSVRSQLRAARRRSAEQHRPQRSRRDSKNRRADGQRAWRAT